MRKLIALLLSSVLVVSGCAPKTVATETVEVASTRIVESTLEEVMETKVEIQTETEQVIEPKEDNILEFDSLNDPELLSYMEDTIYESLIDEFQNEDYYIEKVEAIYLSNEYLEEVAYNSKANIYFGYTVDELNEQFLDTKYVLTLGENGETIVQELEAYDDTVDQIVHDVAVGTGVILICVTVSVVSGGLGAPAVSAIFMTSAQTGTVVALSGATFGATTAGVIKGIQTGDMDEALSAATLAGAEGFKWGAIGGAVIGGASQAIRLRGATANGLTMNEAASIQKESKYSLNILKKFRSTQEYGIFRKAGLQQKVVGGNKALVRKIDLNRIDENGLTNLQRIYKGLSPLDDMGVPYELHHIGQEADSPLAILTKAEHRLGDNFKILHGSDSPTNVYFEGNKWDKEKFEFWKSYVELVMDGGI